MIAAYRRMVLLGCFLVLVTAVFLLTSIGGNISSANAVPLAVEEDGMTTAVDNNTALCRFGVNALHDINNIVQLRVGWYVDYRARLDPPTPNGIQYKPIIKVGDYPNLNEAAILAAVAAHPGNTWFIGNEPDRRYVQDDLEPHEYAAAYHYLYHLIKNADPTAQIVAGNIVQPTPVRLYYLDLILQSYRQQFGVAMPVDIWGIHNFILNERSCELSGFDDCWGAEIPPGINWIDGQRIGINDNDRFDLFEAGIVRFRQWMKSRGYGGLPLYLSEYGILMPADYGFTPARVNAFMSQTFDYLLTASHPQLGDPNDDYRLVQRLSWYSDIDKEFNGWLYDRDLGQLSAVGQNYANYTANISDKVDLYPVRISANPPAPFSAGESVTITLQARVANSGNLANPTEPVTVRFYVGDPLAGGVQIGDDQVVGGLTGCGSTTTAAVVWSNAPPGAHLIYAWVDPDNLIDELNTTNNVNSQTVLVATERVFLPVVGRASFLFP
jgi:hypothetical protein